MPVWVVVILWLVSRGEGEFSSSVARMSTWRALTEVRPPAGGYLLGGTVLCVDRSVDHGRGCQIHLRVRSDTVVNKLSLSMDCGRLWSSSRRVEERRAAEQLERGQRGGV